MKRLLLVVIATVLLVAPSYAQSKHDITIPEFRQVFVDLGSWIDAQKGTDFARQFQAIDDDTLTRMYPAVPDGRQFQSLVRQLKQQKFGVRSRTQAGANFRSNFRSNFNGAGPLVATPACGAPDTIIQNGGACTPAYPDPTDGPWQFMVNVLNGYVDPNGIGPFSPTDYASVSMQGCSLDAEIVLQQVFVILSAVVNSASPFCNIIPAPFNALCWAPVGAIEIANSVLGGFFQDCIEQDGLVNAAKIDAAFQNTVTVDADLGKSTATLAGDINTSTTILATDISLLDNHLTIVDNHISAEFTALSAQLAAALTQLTTQLTNSTALSNAQHKQIMKENLTPDGQKVLNSAILTCTGTNCPNVLAHCPAAGCSWNNVGPLP